MVCIERSIFTLFYTFESFSHQRFLIVSHRSLSYRKSSQVLMTLLSILADFNNAVVWMVPTHFFIPKSSSPFINALVTVPSAPITIDITVTFMFHNFFSVLYQGLGTYFSFCFLSVLTSGQPERQSPKFRRFSFLFFSFLLTTSRSGCLAEIRGSVCISK